MRIYVRSLNWLGDAVFQSAALRLLQAANPTAEILLMAKPSVADVVGAYGIGTLLPWSPSLGARATTIRRSKADLAILLPKSLTTAFEARLGGVPERWGWASQGRTLLLTRCLDRWSESDHYATRFRALMESAFPAIRSLPPASTSLQLPEAWRDEASKLLTAGTMRPIILAPGASGGTAKQWPAKSWHELADLILQAGYPIQVVGKTEEAPLGSYLAEAGPGVSDLMGRTNLRQLGALVTASALVIGNDSGVIHLSSALGTRVLTIFGPTSPRATYPTGADACVLWNQVACAPCFKRVCPIDHPCMRDLQAGEVWATAQALLNGQVPTSPHIVPRPDLRGIALA